MYSPYSILQWKCSAEDWNLSKPLKTCHLLVEQRGDTLFADFTDGSDGSLFCQAQINLVTNPDLRMDTWLEPVVDSSRYFVIKIHDPNSGREALVGFGFRDREKATDLREATQYYEKSVQRDAQAKSASAPFADFTVPKLADDEKIHVNRGAAGGAKAVVTKTDNKTGGGGGAVPLLKKKPPAEPGSEDTDDNAGSKDAVDKVAISFGDINLVESHATGGKVDEEGSDEDSGGAVYEGDEEQWATEFAMKWMIEF